jgi:hypothetical protein
MEPVYRLLVFGLFLWVEIDGKQVLVGTGVRPENT